jgi:tetratricopeptide (TPR) repeat protein
MDSSSTDALLLAGGDALRRHNWQTAFDQFSAAGRRRELSPRDLESLAEAAWWSGHLDACIDARERAYRAYADAGDAEHAAFVALMLVRHNVAKASAATALGWLKRAERLLETTPVCATHGYLTLIRGTTALHHGEFARASTLALESQELGQRFGDRVLEVRALHLRGSALLRQGRVVDGIDLIDEAVATAVSGELGPDAVGTIYCNTIEACHDLADIRRASEWTEAAKRWCDREAVGGFPGICRVFRAEVSRMRGDWHDAESEARRACDELRDFNHAYAGAAYAELGELRLRMGDYRGAEEAFQQGYQLGHSCQPGLALLRLASGKTTSALLSIQRALEDERRGPLARARLLPACVTIALAAGQHDTARAAAVELEQVAVTYGTPALRAAAQSALASLALAQRDARDASKRLREALRLWIEVDAPYETALIRTQLAAAHRMGGDEDAAAMELRAARSAFELLGATADAARLAAMLSDSGASSSASHEISVAPVPATWEGALADRYVVEKELGQGGMATVYLAHDRRNQRSVAIKVLSQQFTNAAERFRAEVSIVSRLVHPHIVPLFDSGEAGGQLYYVMPYIVGETLRARLRREGQLPASDIVRIGREVADALEYAHGTGIIHRDIKPENILLQHGHALVGDFGIARAVDGSESAQRLTETGLLVGTPAYMSPEQATGEVEVDARSDIYSLGCVLYELLTGEPPFAAGSVRSQVAQRLLRAPRTPRVLRPDVSVAMEAVVIKALSLEPSDRFAAANDFAHALASAG